MKEDKKVLTSPVFIVSSGRSGTTLLRNLLNASNQIVFPYESDFIARAYPFYQKKQSFNKQDYQHITRLFIRNSQKKGWHMSEEYILSSLKRHMPQTFANVNSCIAQAYLAKEGFGNLRWGIKTPVLIASLDRINQVFPDAQIIHIVRDSRDVYLSYQEIQKKSPSPEKFGPRNVLQATLYWVDGLRQVEYFRSFNKKNSKLVYELRFEDLINNPHAELQKLFGFLELTYDPAIPVTYRQAKANQKLLKLQEHHSQNLKNHIKTKIESENKRKYLEQIPKRERLLVESIAAPYLAKYGYPLEFKWLSLPIYNPLRNLIYLSAEKYNKFRYHKRDLLAYHRSMATFNC